MPGSSGEKASGWARLRPWAAAHCAPPPTIAWLTAPELQLLLPR